MKINGEPLNSKQKPKTDGKGFMVRTEESRDGSLGMEEVLVLQKILDKHAWQEIKFVYKKVKSSLTY